MPEFAHLRTMASAAAMAAAMAALTWAAPASGEPLLAERLRELAAAHGFRIEGIGKIGVEAADEASGDLATRLRLLLAGYNHVVDGVPPAVQRVIILGPKVPAPVHIVVATTRRQGHHLVSAELQGTPGRSVAVDLMVDTGASSIVLPESMLEPLGYRSEGLEERRSQTANGTVTGRIARLAAVRIGGAAAADVAVLFVADDRLGGVSLLGMSFLERFAITLDDAESRLLLTPR